jgi:nucleoside-diphosphate-sugar epimerase
MKKIFITGGSGYVGRNIIREAIESGYSVVALARSKASVDMVEECNDPALFAHSSR